MTAPQEKPLSPKQAKFVREYFKDSNASQAAIRSGYSKRNPDVVGPRLLVHVGIAAEIARRQTAIMVRSEDNQIASLRELKTRLTHCVRGNTFNQDVIDLEKRVAEKTETIDDLLASRKECTDAMMRASLTMSIATERQRRVDLEVEIKRLKVAHARESNQANMTLLKTKGALDPSRKPHGDRGQVVDDFMLALVKNTDGPGLKAKMEAASPIDV